MENHKRSRRRILFDFVQLSLLIFGSAAAQEKRTNDDLNTKNDWKRLFQNELLELSQQNAIKFDDSVISRIIDSHRNPTSEEIAPIFILAAGGKWDFILLIWCTSKQRSQRAMAYLLHRTIRDKDNLSTNFNFKEKLELFSVGEAQRRQEELDWIDGKFRALGITLANAAEKTDKKWAEAIRSVIESE